MDELDEDELEEELDELELLLEELLEELLELLLVEPEPPLQLPGVGLFPETTKVSIFAKPALLVAFKLNKLFPACRVTVAVSEFAHVVHAPVPLKAKLAAAFPFTSKLPERAVEPFA